MENNNPPINYRKHGNNYVVDIDNVWNPAYTDCLIPLDDPTYQAWLALGNLPLEQDE